MIRSSKSKVGVLTNLQKQIENLIEPYLCFFDVFLHLFGAIIGAVSTSKHTKNRCQNHNAAKTKKVVHATADTDPRPQNRREGGTPSETSTLPKNDSKMMPWKSKMMPYRTKWEPFRRRLRPERLRGVSEKSPLPKVSLQGGGRVEREKIRTFIDTEID